MRVAADTGAVLEEDRDDGLIGERVRELAKRLGIAASIGGCNAIGLPIPGVYLLGTPNAA